MVVGIIMAGVAAAGAIAGSIQDKRAATSARRARREQVLQQIEQLRDENQQQLVGRQRLAGRQRAAFGAAGVRSNTGTALAVQNQQFADAILTQSRILKGVRNLQLGIQRDREAVENENFARLFQTATKVLSFGIDAIPNYGTPPQNSAPAATTTKIRNQGIGTVT